MWFIFLDHIPDNAFSWLTLRNYGFSDTAEVFVFVSGYTCMLAYGGTLREQGWPTTITRALRRGWEIYGAFLLLLIAYFVLIWMAGGGERYLDETNTAVFFGNPGTALVHAAVLQYTPVNTDILPVFVLVASGLSGAAVASDPQSRGRTGSIILALSHGAEFQLAYAGVAERRVVFQSFGMAATVRVRCLVCI